VAGTRRGLSAALLFTLGCGPDDGVSHVPEAPEILAGSVAGNPGNVLSAVVTARVRLADSVGVRYGPAGTALDSVAPAVALSGESVDLPVLGLLPDTRYNLAVVAYGGGQVVLGETLDFVTGTLPADLPGYMASGSDPSPGYVVFGAGMYGLAIDNSGRVVWYHRFPYGPGLNFQVQPTGRYYARPTTPIVGDFEPWMEIDPLGTVTRTFGCAGGLVARFHDLVAEPNGSVWLLCDETRAMDLTAVGGVANAQVTGTVVQHLDADGALLFQWSPFDHFSITDLDAADRAGTTVNWTHGNALAFDVDGNLLVSFRSLSELTKIDVQTGAVLWRLGGLRNQFSFESTSGPPFARQHGLRVCHTGDLILLDNSGDPSASRAERYTYDATARTARLVASYSSLPPVNALLGGTTQELPGGRTLVAYGNGGRVEEYEAGGAVVWRIDGNPGYVFRAQRIQSLYRPGVYDPR